MNELPRRKNTRLKNYNYSQNGGYFITICTKDKKNLFGAIEGGNMILNAYGNIVKSEILLTSSVRENVKIENYVIMPNHIHLIVTFLNNTLIQSQTVGYVVRGIKSATSRKTGLQLWQRGYHDHIIRNEQDFLKIYDYIDNNTLKWELDKYYA